MLFLIAQHGGDLVVYEGGEVVFCPDCQESHRRARSDG